MKFHFGNTKKMAVVVLRSIDLQMNGVRALLLEVDVKCFRLNAIKTQIKFVTDVTV